MFTWCVKYRCTHTYTLSLSLSLSLSWKTREIRGWTSQMPCPWIIFKLNILSLYVPCLNSQVRQIESIFVKGDHIDCGLWRLISRDYARTHIHDRLHCRRIGSLCQLRSAHRRLHWGSQQILGILRSNHVEVGERRRV